MQFRYFYPIERILGFSSVDTMENKKLLLKEESQRVLAENFDIRITKIAKEEKFKSHGKQKSETRPVLSTHEDSSNENWIDNGTLSTSMESPLDETKVKNSNNLDGIEKSSFLKNESHFTKKKRIPFTERMYIKTNDKYHCADCNKPYGQTGAVNRHYRKTHLDNIYRCDQCVYETKDKYLLKAHLKTHFQKFKCEYCQQAFLSFKYKTVHAKSAHEQYCNKCDRAFVHYSQLELHIKIDHEGKGQEHFCRICMKIYLKLDEHMKKEHRPPKSYPCQKCKTEFRSKKLLKSHKHKPVRYY